jgi:hypothetical protein
MSFKSALTALGNLSVTGIANNYGITVVPDSLGRAQLPALLVLPIDTQEAALFRQRGAAFEGVAFSSGTKTVRYVTTHLLLIAPFHSGKGLRAHLTLLADSIDNYFSALGADVTLGGALDSPAEVQIEPGIFKIGDIDYVGCALRHTWVIGI